MPSERSGDTYVLKSPVACIFWASTLSEASGIHTTHDGQGLIKTVVLIDSPGITGPVSAFLRSFDWTVFEAANCGQARGLISRYKPDCVIMELLLPLETGFEFCAFLKKAECRIAVVIFTEVRLDEARNLAMWAGADAYITKPTDPAHLQQQVVAAAQRVSQRIRKIETGMAGSISFRCRCGKVMKVGSRHAGRAVVCPACKHLAKCPESLLDSGTLFRSMIEARQGVRSSRTGIACQHCHMIVDPRKCRVRDHYECTRCHKRMTLAEDVFDEWHLFFGDQSAEAPLQEFNPLRYVFVQCENCRILHQYFRNADNPQPCPGCGRLHQLPSIRGVPVSRAALESTGRLFEFLLTDGRRKLFLLPSMRKWMVGSSPNCPIALHDQPLHPQHCALKNTPEGPTLLPVNPSAQSWVNGTLVTERTLLHPGDQIRLGGVELVLHGTPEKQLKRRLAQVLDDATSTEKLIGELELGEPGARVLQYHWELLRLKWIEQIREQQPSYSSESSVIQQISHSDLQ